jgi:hypothetical protein
MAHFLFIDESGGQEAPLDVLAGIAVEDRDLWNLVLALQEAEVRIFGRRYTSDNRELKAKKILKTKTSRLAQWPLNVSDDAQRALAQKALDAGASASRLELVALAKAKLKYAQEALDICARFRCKAFASLVSKDAPALHNPHLLRKDYAYLFERFFYFLEDAAPASSGIIVFDELEKSQSHVLVDQLDSYFKRTAKGRQRVSRIIPEPFFVHSDLTTGIQLADLVAYIISWGLRFEGMVEPKRPELKEFADQVMRLRTRAVRAVDSNPNYTIWSFALVSDLRSKDERERE